MSEKRGGPNLSSRRIQLIDAARGLCVILMVCHHLLYDLVEYLGAPSWFFYNPVFNFLHYVFAGLFILLSGVSSRFSRSNIRRGIKVLIAALIVTFVTLLVDSIVIFGILHFLGFCMVFYGLTQKFWDRFTGQLAPLLYIVLTAVTALILNALNPVKIKWLWIFGLWDNNFFSADYFPLLPWIFVFLLGTWLGRLIKDGKLPRWFYTANPPLLPKIGRRAFIVYLLHQPVMLAIVMLIKLIFNVK